MQHRPCLDPPHWAEEIALESLVGSCLQPSAFKTCVISACTGSEWHVVQRILIIPVLSYISAPCVKVYYVLSYVDCWDSSL